jgi:hypothetical protein
MAKRESSLNPAAKAQTSSAAGLFQFIEQTWLGAVKTHGAKHGLSDYAADITRRPNGKFAIADPARRQEILNLRFDANAASALAGELANDNKRALESRLGRGVSNAELYAAHFLGAGGASTLLTASDDAVAATLLPRAAAANRHVFYDGDRARSVGEVMASIAKSMGETKAALPTFAAAPALEHKSAAAPALADRLRDGVSLGPIKTSAPAGFHTVNTTLAAFRDPDLPGRIPAAPKAASEMQLSALAMQVLQALDPTRLGSSRDDRDARSLK